ncbi:MAG: (2Fe-2S)-binding protein [Syntrophorhabdales bacterium]|jgi:carbon-monoxide dehydrogenase small subunit
MTKQPVTLTVNDQEYQLLVSPTKTLLDVLRDKLGLTGTKRGCDSGECGSCTVLADGIPILSCMTLAVEAEGKNIRTIEGVAKGGEFHRLQKAFVEKGAIQCGFCTPGMILSAVALLESNPSPTPEEIKKGISGNFCRCTGYVKIIEAIGSVAK